MNRVIQKAVAAGLGIWIAVCGISGNTVQAGQTCTMTFRAGNAGSFDVKKVETSIKDQKLVSVRPEYIKIKTARGQSVERALYDAFGRGIQNSGDLNALFLGFLKENPEYTMLRESSWGPGASDLIERNQEYVVDYGVLVDPVAYSISYVDKKSGDAVATPVMNYGNDGDVVECAPVTVGEYETADEPVTLTLAKGEKNAVTFYYQYTGKTYVPGKITYRTEYEDVTKTAEEDAQGTTGSNRQAAAGRQDPAQQQEGETIDERNADERQLLDENVPLASGKTDREEETEQPQAGQKTIEDENVPLTDRIKQMDAWMLGGIAAAAGAAVAVIAATIVSVRKKGKRR